MNTRVYQWRPYKHPSLGWYFSWPYIILIDGAVYVGKLAFKWNSKQPFRLRPKLISGRRWKNDEIEPDMYIWLKFNISLSNGWGIGLTYR